MSMIVGLGKRTVTGLITTGGRQFADWSADYRIFSKNRFRPEEMFSTIREGVLAMLPEDSPVVAAMDDTIMRKSGTRTPGVSYRLDPMGPKFHKNFVRAQRFVQVSMAVPEGEGPGPARMIPVDIKHAPTPKKPRWNATGEEVARYNKLKNEMKLSTIGVERMHALRNALDSDPGGADRRLVLSVDGSYTNSTVLKNIPENTTLIGRIRKDAKLFHHPDEDMIAKTGRRRVYGRRAPTPEELRKDKTVAWEKYDVWACGKIHTFEVKTIAPLRSKTAGGSVELRMIAIRPLAYRKSKGSRVLYRKPAYIICTDPDMPVEKVLQRYFWRWDIEVNFRDQKQLIGAGKAQVRCESSVELLPAFATATYAALLLAACRTYGVHGLTRSLPPPKWRAGKQKPRASTQDLINEMRVQMWGRSMGVDSFSGFVTDKKDDTKPVKLKPHLPSALFYTVA